MTYTETIKKVVYSLAFVVALVLVVLALTLGLGLKINSNVVARAEGETRLLESITFGVNEDYQDDMTAVLVEGDSIAPYTDAEFTVTSLRSAGWKYPFKWKTKMVTLLMPIPPIRPAITL